MKVKTALLFVALCAGSTTAHAQVEVLTEAQASGAIGDHQPLWLHANKYGLGSLDSLSGYVRAGLFRHIDADSARRWALGGGVDVVAGRGIGSNVVLHQAYGQVRWLKGVLTVGSKEQRAELKNQELSTGSQTLGVNARPVPGVRLELPDYWLVPGLRGWLGLRGHIFYGMTTDDHWQKDFTATTSKYTKHTKLHTKAGFLRIGKEGKPFHAEIGIEMGCQYGGTSYIDLGNGLTAIDNEDGLRGMLRALVPSGGEVGEGLYHNTSGNHVGSYLLRLNLERRQMGLSLYADHYFEDHSQMFFIDYDGYGQGDEFNEWKDRRWFVYDFRDVLIGAELRLKQLPAMSRVVLEYVYSKYQSGPVYHDRTRLLSDHVAGRDEYYNHSIYTGWQHWGQVMGNPLYRSPLYNADGQIRVMDNRFWAWHVGVSGDPVDAFHYRVLATLQRGWGTYTDPLPDPRSNVSLLFEGEYRWPDSGWSLRGALGMDFGGLLGDQVGAQLTVARRFRLTKN